jgi:hypothetical protein
MAASSGCVLYGIGGVLQGLCLHWHGMVRLGEARGGTFMPEKIAKYLQNVINMGDDLVRLNY